MKQHLKAPIVEFRNQSEDNVVNLKDIINAFRRRLLTFLTLFALANAAVILGTFQIVPLYKAQTSIMIDFQNKPSTDFNSLLSGNPPDATFVDTEVETIKSRRLAEKVALKLDLFNDPEFNYTLREPTKKQKWKEGVVRGLKSFFPAQVDNTKNTSVDDSLNALEQAKAEELILNDKVISAVSSRLGVGRKGLTYVVDLSYKSQDPAKAAKIANAFADQYLVEQLDAKFEATGRINGWLNERLSSLRSEVRIAETAVEQYRANSGLVSTKGSSLAEQQISDINARIIVQQAEYNESNARLRNVEAQVASGASPDSIAEVLSSTTIRDLRREQSIIRSRKADLSSRYGSRHPQIAKVDQEMSDIDRQLSSEIKRIVANLRTENEIAKQRVASLQQSLRKLKTEHDQNNRSLVRLRELEREAEVSQNLYNNFLEKFKQSNDQDEIIEADARVISQAVIPESQSTPKLKLNILFGLFLGTVLGLMGVILREIFETGLATKREVEQDLRMPFLAFVPQVGGGIVGLIQRIMGKQTKPFDYIVDKPFSAFAESYRTIRTEIMLNRKDGSTLKTIAFVSPNSGDGKTTSALCLARLSAMSGSKTIVIDCDMRKRALSKQLPHFILEDKDEEGSKSSKKAKTDVDFNDFLSSNKKDWEPYLRKDQVDNLDFISLGTSEHTPRDILGSKKFKVILAELSKKYDLVVIDTPPVLPVAETRIVANLVDGVVLTTRWRKTSKDAALLAKQILMQSGANIIGVIMTQVDLTNKLALGTDGMNYSAYRQYYEN